MSSSRRKYALALGVALITVAVIAGPPVGAHVTKSVKHTWKHIRPLADARYELKGTPSQWGQIQGMPAGFADGIDNTGGGGPATDLSCSACVQEGELTFDPATQSELDTHKTSGDHDSRYWRLTGNAGTSPASNFLGTTDNVVLELRVNGVRAFRLEPNATSPNVIGGFSGNSVTGGVFGATIGGGGGDPDRHLITDSGGTIGGGLDNQAGDAAGTTGDAGVATVGGGTDNTASGSLSTVGGGARNQATVFAASVGGGEENTASGFQATVAGGGTNTASGFRATVGGGNNNTASGIQATVGGGNNNTASDNATVGGGNTNTASDNATVPGGISNTASGFYSFAAGRRAKAIHQGAFVWADSNNFDFSSSGLNTWDVRATGGSRFVSAIDGNGNPSAGVLLNPGSGSWSGFSDRKAKDHVVPVDPRKVLEGVVSIPIATWNYKSQDPSVRHIGPMAQDFHAAFGVGEDERYIGTIDADGVALAAIQGLNERIDQLEGQRQGSGPPLTAGLLPALGLLGLALGIALVGRKALGGLSLS